MSATELSLLGQLPAELHATLAERLSAQAQDAYAYTLSEAVYTRVSSAASEDGMVRIRVLKSSKTSLPEWSIMVLQKSESARLSPYILQRGCTECAVLDGCHPAILAGVLGFGHYAFSLFQRGSRFHSGAIMISVYQLYESETAASPIDPSTYTVSVATRLPPQPRQISGQPNTSSTQELKAAAVAAVHQISAQLKGVVDLTRVD